MNLAKVFNGKNSNIVVYHPMGDTTVFYNAINYNTYTNSEFVRYMEEKHNIKVSYYNSNNLTKYVLLNTETKCEKNIDISKHKSVFYIKGKYDKIFINWKYEEIQYTVDGIAKQKEEYEKIKNDYLKECLFNKYQVVYDNYIKLCDQSDEGIISVEDSKLLDQYNLKFKLANMELEESGKFKEEKISYDKLLDISDVFTTNIYNDVYFDKDINFISPLEVDAGQIVLNNTICNIDLNCGLYILDCSILYSDCIKDFCNKYDFTYEIKDTRWLEFDKINGKYISSIIGKMSKFKQFYKYEDAVNFKKEFINNLYGKLNILRPNIKNAIDDEFVLLAYKDLNFIKEKINVISTARGLKNYSEVIKTINNKLNNVIKKLEENIKNER